MLTALFTLCGVLDRDQKPAANRRKIRLVRWCGALEK